MNKKSSKPTIYRIITKEPIYTKYEGVCKVCKSTYSPGELISPFFDDDKNYWRHTTCFQLFFIEFSYSGNCNTCGEEIQTHEMGYWSKHNGVWCNFCGDKLSPKTIMTFSRSEKDRVETLKNLKQSKASGV
jgi:hypothetical protein